VIATNDTGNAIPAGGSATLGSGGVIITQNQVFTAYTAGSAADLFFQPGWYVFDGTAASVSLTKGTFSCVNTAATPDTFLAGGCVFVFRNGASLNLQGQNSKLRCSPGAGGTPAPPSPATDYLGCAFEFHDRTIAPVKYGTFSLTNKVGSVNLTPLTYQPKGTPLPPPTRLSIVWSDDNFDCTGGGTCAVDLSQGCTQAQGCLFNVGGTIFVKTGIYRAGSNASASSGQVVADTMLVQGGSSALGSAIVYKGALVAPVPGAPFLFE